MKVSLIGSVLLIGLTLISNQVFALFGPSKADIKAKAQRCLLTYNQKAPARRMCCSNQYKSMDAQCQLYPVVFSLKQRPAEPFAYYNELSTNQLALTTMCQIAPHDFRQVIISCDKLLKNPAQYTANKVANLTPRNQTLASACLKAFNDKSKIREVCCSKVHDVFHDCGPYPLIMLTKTPEYNNQDLDKLMLPSSYKKRLSLRTLCQKVNTENDKLSPYVAKVVNLDCQDLVQHPKKYAIYIAN